MTKGGGCCGATTENCTRARQLEHTEEQTELLLTATGIAAAHPGLRQQIALANVKRRFPAMQSFGKHTQCELVYYLQ